MTVFDDLPDDLFCLMFTEYFTWQDYKKVFILNKGIYSCFTRNKVYLINKILKNNNFDVRNLLLNTNYSCKSYKLSLDSLSLNIPIDKIFKYYLKDNLQKVDETTNSPNSATILNGTSITINGNLNVDGDLIVRGNVTVNGITIVTNTLTIIES